MSFKGNYNRLKKNNRKYIQEVTFTCSHCGRIVETLTIGSRHRNHCPYCLWSLHLDIRPGDRVSICRGLMEPISIWHKKDGEIMLIHRCTRCGIIKTNRLSGDDDSGQVRKIVDNLINKDV